MENSTHKSKHIDAVEKTVAAKSASKRRKPNKKVKMDMNINELKSLKSLKSWRLFSSVRDDEDEEGTTSFLLTWGRERAFQLLGLFSLIMCALLFMLQAYLALRSYQIMHQLNTKRQIPEMLYQIYFDGHDWALDLDKVDLRANTTLFMH